MNLHYFKGCKDFNEVKKAYKDSVKKYHPDINKGIDVRLIQDLNAQYSYIEKNVIRYPILDVKAKEPIRKQYNAAEEFRRKAQEQASNVKGAWKEYDEKAKEDYNKQKQRQYQTYTNQNYTKEKVKEEPKVDLNEKIRKAYQGVLDKGYKPYTLYHRFLAYCKEKNIVADKSNFELIGELLGYKKGWATFKYEEYLQEIK